jgi:hypothetical protein
MGEQPLSVQDVFDRALEIDSDAGRKDFLDEVAAAAPEVLDRGDCPRRRTGARREVRASYRLSLRPGCCRIDSSG